VRISKGGGLALGRAIASPPGDYHVPFAAFRASAHSAPRNDIRGTLDCLSLRANHGNPRMGWDSISHGDAPTETPFYEEVTGMAIAEVSIVPLGTGSPSVSQYVAEAISVLQEEKDVKYELTSMGTIIEGDLDGIFRVIRRMHETPFDKGVMRVVTSVKIDDRRDRAATGQDKIESVKKNLKA